MKRFLLSSAIVLALAAGGYMHNAAADKGPSTCGPAAGGPDHPPGPWDHGWGPGPGFPPGPGPGPGFGPGPGPDGWKHGDEMSLFTQVKDKKLTPDDVKTIAAAMLLEHGNHDWAVSNIGQQPDKTIDFSFATAHGDVIATFSIDPASGHVKRLS